MPRRPKTIAQIRAKVREQKSIIHMDPNSGYARLRAQNLAVVEMEFLAVMDTEPVAGEAEKVEESEERRAKDVKVEATKKKGAAKPEGVRKSRRRRRVVLDSEDDEPAGTWCPYGGENAFHGHPPNPCLGIARVPNTQLEDFMAALYDRLQVYGGAELSQKELNVGGETQTDIEARFSDMMTAEIVQVDMDGEMLLNRKMQVKFAKEW